MTGMQEEKKFDLRLGLVSGILLCLAFYMIWVSISTYIRGIAGTQFKMIDATVADLEQHFDPFGLRKEARMSYKVEGKEFSSVVPIPQGRVVKKGEQTVVFCNPQNPVDALLSNEIDYDLVTVMGAFGFFALSFGVLIATKSIKPRTS